MDIRAGDVVRLGDGDGLWRDCLMVVSEVKPWGVKGSIYGPGQCEYPVRIALSNVVAVYRLIGPASRNTAT